MSHAHDIIIDVWHQFCLDVTIDGEEWQSDGSLSTMEHVADYLVESGYLIKHPSREVYRVKQ